MNGQPRRFQRVLILTQYYPPEIGAAPIRLRATARELRRLGFDVRVLTGMPNYPTGRVYSGYEGRLRMADCVDDVPVTRVWLYPAAGRSVSRRILNYLSFTVSSALALIFEPRADLVFVEAQPMTLAIPAFLNHLIRGTPYVYNTPDLQIEYADEDKWTRGTLFIRAARALEGFLMRRAFSVTTVTRAFVDHFHRERAIPLDRLTFLPNGADTERMHPLPYDSALADRLGVGGRKVFTFAGTFASYQGLEVILQAAHLLQDRQDLVFLLVGDGPVRGPLIAQARDTGLNNVIFRPAVPPEEIPALMSITWAALVVLRKLRVATKMRLAKAIPPLACGVPLVYAGWGETAELVKTEQVGLIVEPEDPRALASAIADLADNAALRNEMGRRGRALAEREFSWALIVANWVREIEVLADRDRTGPTQLRG